MQKILVVDDDPNIREIVDMCLEDAFEVTLVTSGKEALEACHGAKPDVILLDMMMPEMDGMATLAKLKADSATASIPVIFLTAKVLTHEVEKYQGLDIIGILSKPFDPITLPDEIQALIDRHK